MFQNPLESLQDDGAHMRTVAGSSELDPAGAACIRVALNPRWLASRHGDEESPEADRPVGRMRRVRHRIAPHADAVAASARRKGERLDLFFRTAEDRVTGDMHPG